MKVTPQIPALAGMTPLGSKPNTPPPGYTLTLYAGIGSQQWMRKQKYASDETATQHAEEILRDDRVAAGASSAQLWAGEWPNARRVATWSLDRTTTVTRRKAESWS